MAAQLTFTNGPFDRSLHLWIASAISSLPVPVSPWINTVESVGATTRTRRSNCCRAVLLPIIVGKALGRNSFLSSPTFTDPASSTPTHPFRLIGGSSRAQLVPVAIVLTPYFHPVCLGFTQRGP